MLLTSAVLARTIVHPFGCSRMFPYFAALAVLRRSPEGLVPLAYYRSHESPDLGHCRDGQFVDAAQVGRPSPFGRAGVGAGRFRRVFGLPVHITAARHFGRVASLLSL
jgi:hypothetical protein